MREIEALVLRIAEPKGNKQRGRLAGSANLAAEFRALVKVEQKKVLGELFGERRRAAKAAKRARRGGVGERRPLAELVTGPMEIRATYKRRELRATLTKGGEVRTRGRVFPSLSAAAEFIVRRPRNGWSFWRYEAKPGEWVPLTEKRRTQG